MTNFPKIFDEAKAESYSAVESAALLAAQYFAEAAYSATQAKSAVGAEAERLNRDVECKLRLAKSCVACADICVGKLR